MNTTFTKDILDENGNVVAELSATIDGNNVPLISTMGNSKLVGYDENGYPIMSSVDDELIEKARLEFTKEVMKMHAMLESMK